MNNSAFNFPGINNFTQSFFVILFFYILSPHSVSAQDQPPYVTAVGNQIYCPGTPMPIVTDFNIADPDDTGTDAIYIQISVGYVNGQDFLSLPAGHPNIASNWDATSGKLILHGVGGDVPYTDLIAAVEDVQYTNTSAAPTGSRNFSITVGEANYLPSTDHYYIFIPQLGITWTSAKAAAEASNYYGLQGYLATLLSIEEAQLCGEQASGNGWIGGSDAAAEGVWRWMTGPEAGTVFWNGGVGGTTPNFAFWNSSEPNNLGEEDYAHVTAPGIGVPGSWNDQTNSPGSTGAYAAQGYIVEYGGMPGDPVLHISASTTINFPKITTNTPASRCGDGTVTLGAVAGFGAPIHWYTSATGATEVGTGATFTTPVISATTTYYASPYESDCTTVPRTAITATVNPLPIATVSTPVNVCGPVTATLEGVPSAGIISWYDAPTGGNLVGTGNSIQSPVITSDTTFYAEVVNNGCTSATRIAVDVYYHELPAVGPDEDVVFCENGDTDIDADITGVTYLWSTGQTSQTINITEAGTYTVTVTNPSGCSATRTFTATALTAPDIKVVAINTDVAIIIMENGDPENYEFSVDGLPYQDSNQFNGLLSGYHTASVLSRNGCGEDFYNFIVYLIPKFFTPNGDNINDVFTLAGMYTFPEATVDIFDRYGKLIAQLSRKNRSWDGTYNGYPLPATDYWYVVKIDNATPEIRGHFTLMR